jgi:hypothetical protein
LPFLSEEINVKQIFLHLCVLIGLTSTLAHADLKYTTETEIAGMPAGVPKSTMVRMVKPNLERIETVQKIGPASIQTVMLRDCKKNQSIQLDPQLKIYTVMPALLDSNGRMSTRGSGGASTGKMSITYAVKDLGSETIINRKTRHYSVAFTMQSSGCAGTGKISSKQEIWVSDVRGASPCKFDRDMIPGMAAVTHRNCKIKVETKGDAKKYGVIMDGLILRQKTYNGNTLLSTQEVTALSQSKLNDSLFKVPAGYKKVSPQEFQKLRSKAMLQGGMGGMFKLPQHED